MSMMLKIYGLESKQILEHDMLPSSDKLYHLAMRPSDFDVPLPELEQNTTMCLMKWIVANIILVYPNL